MECANARDSAGFTLVARRNNSLSPAGRRLVLSSLFLISVAISGTFAIQGAWLVLPFAGLEMLAVVAAFAYLDRHASDFESLTIQGDRVLIERRELGRVSRYEFNRYWAQVVWQPTAPGRHARLALRSHGRQVEFGCHLTDEQRGEAAGIIKDRLRHT